ncbi:hypothetical protein Ciccas_001383 [Cichlidogyrus casuarinus]|uniref:Uncharacterized protein n=1 Tax=Cichlidogyrus casuarinus TaxID=1844966 RepID=A0ABD2QLC0_9PLAT
MENEKKLTPPRLVSTSSFKYVRYDRNVDEPLRVTRRSFRAEEGDYMNEIASLQISAPLATQEADAEESAEHFLSVDARSAAEASASKKRHKVATTSREIARSHKIEPIIAEAQAVDPGLRRERAFAQKLLQQLQPQLAHHPIAVEKLVSTRDISHSHLGQIAAQGISAILVSVNLKNLDSCYGLPQMRLHSSNLLSHLTK